MLCICGLGNPGLKYKNNRHNLGFIVLDLLRLELDLPKFESGFSGKFSKGQIKDKSVILFKPMLYMNNSGFPINLLCNFYKINLDNLLVIHDELELEFGKIKIKKAGGSAGHNGIRSIDLALGKDYWRLKIGIDRPEHNDISQYVLSDFSVEQNLEKILNDVKKNFFLFIDENKSFIANIKNTNNKSS